MSRKEIIIDEMKINNLGSQCSFDGEYETNFNIDFLLKEEDQCVFSVFGKEYRIDRIKMMDCFGHSVILTPATPNETLMDFSVPKNYINGVLIKILEQEKKGGQLEKYCFSDELISGLQYDDGRFDGSYSYFF